MRSTGNCALCILFNSDTYEMIFVLGLMEQESGRHIGSLRSKRFGFCLLFHNVFDLSESNPTPGHSLCNGFRNGAIPD